MYLQFLVIPFIYLGSDIIANGQGQNFMTDIKVLKRDDDRQCASVEETERARSEIRQIANSIIAATVTLTTMPTEITTSDSITTTTDMSTTATMTDSTSTMPSNITSAKTMPSMYTCNSTPGWRRVAFINMTDTSYNCPTGLNLTSYSKRTCGRSYVTYGGCSSTTFSAGGLPYSRVCGRIRGYQFGATDAFWAYVNENHGIDSYYATGISLTHGGVGSRQHIWTFAAGLSEVSTYTLPIRALVMHIITIMSLRLLEMISFVRVAYTLPGMVSLYSTPVMSSGMVRNVHPTAHAVSSTILHGLQRT